MRLGYTLASIWIYSIWTKKYETALASSKYVYNYNFKLENIMTHLILDENFYPYDLV